MKTATILPLRTHAFGSSAPAIDAPDSGPRPAFLPRRAPRRASLAVALMTVAALSALGAALPARAAEVVAIGSTADLGELTRFSHAGQQALDRIGRARADLFEGHPQRAEQALRSAQDALRAARAEAPTYAVTTPLVARGRVIGTETDVREARYVPVDGHVSLVDDATATPPPHRGLVERAREFLRRGDARGALSTLRDGRVGSNYTRYWLPIGPAEQAVDMALSQIAQQRYYEANLTLKSMLDGMAQDIVAVETLSAN